MQIIITKMGVAIQIKLLSDNPIGYSAMITQMELMTDDADMINDLKARQVLRSQIEQTIDKLTALKYVIQYLDKQQIMALDTQNNKAELAKKLNLVKHENPDQDHLPDLSPARQPDQYSPEATGNRGTGNDDQA